MLQLNLDLKHEVFFRELTGRRKDIPSIRNSIYKNREAWKSLSCSNKKTLNQNDPYGKCRMSGKEQKEMKRLVAVKRWVSNVADCTFQR